MSKRSRHSKTALRRSKTTVIDEELITSQAAWRVLDYFFSMLFHLGLDVRDLLE